MSKKFPDYQISEAWRYLGTDEVNDYYVVNEAGEDDSLTGVFGNNPGDYWSCPIHMNSVLRMVQEKDDDHEFKKCYNLYKEQDGKFTHDGAEAEQKEKDEWFAREEAKLARQITIPYYLYEDTKEVIKNFLKSNNKDLPYMDELEGVLDDMDIFEDLHPEELKRAKEIDLNKDL